MKKTKFVSSLALLSIGITCFFPAAANAENTPDKETTQNTSEELTQTLQDVVNDDSKDSESTVEALSSTDSSQTVDAEESRVGAVQADDATSDTSETKTTVSNAKLIVTTSDKTTTIDVNGNNQLSKIAEEYGLTLSEYRNSKGEALDPDYKVSDKEELLLFKSEVSAKSEVVELQIPTIEKESDEVYVGETKVESEGKKGKALKTFVETTDLSADKKVNSDAKTSTSPTAQVDSLTVLTKPEAKIVLVGTKEKPKPVVEEPVIEETPVEEPTEEPTTEETTAATPVEEPTSEAATTSSATTSSASKSATATATKDPISGEPLNTTTSTSSSSLGNSSTPNGAKVAASKTQPSVIVSSNKVRGQKAVDLAYTRLGSDYNWASSGERAFDCSGLIYWIYKKNLGVDIPRTASKQGASAQQISISQLQPGDLLYTSSHIGLYIGNGQMIHASRSNDQVVVSGIGWFLSDGAKAARIK